MRNLIASMVALSVVCVAVNVNAQEMELPKPDENHKIVTSDVGTWTVKGKVFMGPDATEMEGKEKVVAVGEFWAVTHFSGEFSGMKFTGSGTTGYDPKSKKFVGSWVDSMNPHVTHMFGTYDKETKTLTFETKGIDMMGNEAKGKIVVVYKNDDSRQFTMHSPDPAGSGKLVKSMEMTYTRVKDEKKTSTK